MPVPGGLGLNAADLRGRTACYQSSGNDALEAAVNGLCPPPEAFHGRRTVGTISNPVGEHLSERRRAEFFPLSIGDGESFSVLAIVDPTPLSADRRSPLAILQPSRWMKHSNCTI